jgi:hypothetical protein
MSEKIEIEKIETEKKESFFKTVGERMKTYEKEFENNLDNSKPFIIRLDGHKFSTFMKPFEKPFDENCKKRKKIQKFPS